jgi:hypothetical protein
MKWLPRKRSPAPVVRPVTGQGLRQIRVAQISRSHCGVQAQRPNARSRSARDAVIHEFGKAGGALDQGHFVGRKPYDQSRLSPKLRRFTRG